MHFSMLEKGEIAILVPVVLFVHVAMDFVCTFRVLGVQCPTSLCCCGGLGEESFPKWPISFSHLT